LVVGFIATLLSYSILQAKVNPYARSIDNILDGVSNIVLLISLISGVIVEIPLFESYQSAVTICAVVLNILYFLLAGICFVESNTITIVRGARKIAEVWRIIFQKIYTFFDRRESEQNSEEIGLLSPKNK